MALRLLAILAFITAPILIPTSWLFGPLLSLLGFGSAGPVAGSAAAWLQSYFWGGAVAAGSWFSFLQAAGMGATTIPLWIGLIIKAPLAIVGGLLGLFLSCFNRT